MGVLGQYGHVGRCRQRAASHCSVGYGDLSERRRAGRRAGGKETTEEEVSLYAWAAVDLCIYLRAAVRTKFTWLGCCVSAYIYLSVGPALPDLLFCSRNHSTNSSGATFTEDPLRTAIARALNVQTDKEESSMRAGSEGGKNHEFDALMRVAESQSLPEDMKQAAAARIRCMLGLD